MQSDHISYKVVNLISNDGRLIQTIAQNIKQANISTIIYDFCHTDKLSIHPRKDLDAQGKPLIKRVELS